ncbi:MAG: CRISPR-associated helicase Cas3' [Gemmatimonadaceae bacterium]
MTELMAKSGGSGGPGRTLAAHTFDVVEAFTSLFGTPGKPTRLSRQWLKFFRLNGAEAFIRNGLAAAWTHDWGKANDGFQALLEGKGKQTLRHEHLSAMLLHLPVIRAWLDSRPDLDQDVILSAVTTHHLKASLETVGRSLGEIDSVIRVRWDHDDFRRLLDRVAAELHLTGPVPEDVMPLWCYEPQSGDFNAAAHLRSLKRRLSDFDDELMDDQPRRRLLWAVRAGLIAADSAGSGLVRERHAITEWIAAAFDEDQLLDGDAIRAKVITPRVDELTAKARWRDWTDFQLACDGLPDRALLLAPCGSGKTLAAWRWIAARLDADKAARVIFLYPTRGTATEGFRDYVSWAPETDAALLHSTSRYDLDGLFADVGDDPRGDRSFESEARLFALEQWPKRIFSATVDQFFAFLQYGYGPICQLPLLVDSVIVVDEVHSFDRGMFSALLDFLRTFDVPVLCMTATLPQERRAKLEACGLHIYPQEMPAELLRSATYPRYHVRRTDMGAAKDFVHQALRERKRVLWVVNNVRRAQALAREFAVDDSAEDLQTDEGTPLFCYHSRFRLIDRKRQHQAVIEAFKRGGPEGAILAITTQVCELSLDLDADVVVTEDAPVTSLIQRMGRGCREALPINGRFAEVLIYPPDNERPYKPEQLQGVEAFVQRIAAPERVSQADLEAALADVPQPKELPKTCQFLDSGPWATTGEESFRETDEFSRPAVLPEDVHEFGRLRRSRDQSWKAEGLIVPVPVYLARGRDNSLPSYLRVAEGGYYVSTLGYLDEQRSPSSWIV